MKYFSCFCSFLLLLCTACTVEEDFHDSLEVEVWQTSVEKSIPIQSRGAFIEQFGEGDSISFYAQGGISATDILLYLRETKWQPQHTLLWNKHKAPAQIIAHYPALRKEVALYKDSELIDRLICKQEVPWGKPIHLAFGHLYARLSVEIPPTLRQILKKVVFTPSHIVDSILPTTGTLQYHTNGYSHPIIEKTYTDIFSLYDYTIPPVPNFSVRLSLYTTTGKKYETIFRPTSYTSNMHLKYKLRIKENTTEKGIDSEEDFIDFLRLLAGRTVEGKSLEDFSQEENGQCIYRLKKDLHLTDRHTQILHEEQLCNYPFTETWTAVFDGGYHTISHLTLAARAQDYIGIFPKVAPEGIIKNLYVENCHISIQGKVEDIGILTGRNLGQINDCHVQGINCSFPLPSPPENCINFVGSIVGSNYGVVANCSAQDIDFSALQNTAAIGGLVGNLTWNGNTSQKGKLLNSYIAHFTATKKKSIKNIGFLAGMDTYAILSACYGYETGGHAICYHNQSSVSTIYFYPLSAKYFSNIKVKNSAGKTCFPYDATTFSTVVEGLNAWIESHQARYPGYTFLRWEATSDTRPARHIGRK